MAKILIVDDEREFVDMLALRLEKSGGYEVVRGYDGEEGLKLAEEQMPDLVVLDIMMPKMDGNELIRRLKKNEKTQNIPIIVLTASTAPSTVDKFLALGAIDFIMKPFEPPELMDKIKQALVPAQN